jgi:DNA repair protein RecO (recombination protein O)
MAITDSTICLRSIDYSETSQVLVMLARANGLVRLLAKGSKRAKSKSGGTIDYFAEGQCTFTGTHKQGLGTLIEFVESVTHTPLRDDLGRLNVGLYMLELCLNVLAEGDPHPEIFDLLHSALARLEQPDAMPSAVLAYFQWRLARRIGLLGDMDRCVSCGTPVGWDKERSDESHRTATNVPASVYFSSSAGGLLCRNCQGSATEKRAVSPAVLAGLAALAAAEAGQRPKLPEPAARAVNALLAYHIQYQIAKPLKMVGHVIGKK